MSVLPLVPSTDPLLRAPADPVPRVDGAVRALVDDLVEQIAAQEGIGIAAPPVGRSLQVFVANPSQVRGHERVLINPVMEALRGRSAVVEGCLSVPEVWERVTRASWVRLRGLDREGRVISLEAEGLLAIILKHECDHLQGRLFLDRISFVRRLLHRRRAGPGPVLAKAGTGACV
jgi:peptide deformylase